MDTNTDDIDNRQNSKNDGADPSKHHRDISKHKPYDTDDDTGGVPSCHTIDSAVKSVKKDDKKKFDHSRNAVKRLSEIF